MQAADRLFSQIRDKAVPGNWKVIMKCKKTTKLISGGLLEGSLEHQNILEHAQSCKACAQELEAYDALVGVLSQSQMVQVPAGLHERIRMASRPEVISCSKAKDMFSDECDQALSWSDRECLSAHVALCQECSQELQAYKLLVETVRETEHSEVAAGLHSRIRAATTGKFVDNKRSWINAGTRIIGAGAGASLVLAGTMMYMNSVQTAVPEQVTANTTQISSPPALGKLPIVQPVPSTDRTAKKTEPASVKSTPIAGSLEVAYSGNLDINLPVRTAVHKAVDPAKAVSALSKKSKSAKQTASTKKFSVIPDIEETKYKLEEHEPVKMDSEPEVVASAAGPNVYEEYATDEDNFSSVAEKVQNKNKLDTWLKKSKTLTEEAKLSKKSANIQLLGFRF